MLAYWRKRKGLLKEINVVEKLYIYIYTCSKKYSYFHKLKGKLNFSFACLYVGKAGIKFVMI